MKLTEHIARSRVLSHWLRQVALTLGQLGPWSWATIQEDALFGFREGPYSQYRIKHPQPVDPSLSKVKYRALNLD